MKRREFLAALGLTASPIAATASIAREPEMALSAVQPVCPRCGIHVLWTESRRLRTAPDSLARVECSCGWAGVAPHGHAIQRIV